MSLGPFLIIYSSTTIDNFTLRWYNVSVQTNFILELNMDYLEELEQKRLNALVAARFLERITFWQFQDCTFPDFPLTNLKVWGNFVFDLSMN